MRKESPFKYLLQIETQIQARTPELPKEDGGEGVWVGLGFLLGQNNLLAPIGDVMEILNPVEGMRVPNVKRWFKGLVNIRGNLLAVVDFYQFIFNEPTSYSSTSRVVVFKDDGVNVGMIVSSVFGVRGFHLDEKVEPSSNLDVKLKKYITHAFRRSGEIWDVLDFKALAESPEFEQISVM